MKKSLFFVLCAVFIVTRPFYLVAQPIFVVDKPDTISTKPLKVKFSGKLVALEDCGVDFPSNVIGDKEALRILYDKSLLSFFGEWELNIEEFYSAPDKRVDNDCREAKDHIEGGLVTYYDSQIGLRWEGELTRGTVTITYTVHPKTMTVHFTKLDIGK
jgi:hypothetical protein